jgi:hypothetical protein
MRRPDQEVDVHRPVLAVLEGPKSVEDERLARRLLGAHSFMKEQAMSAQTVGQAAYGGVRDTGLSRDLTQPGA